MTLLMQSTSATETQTWFIYCMHSRKSSILKLSKERKKKRKRKKLERKLEVWEQNKWKKEITYENLFSKNVLADRMLLKLSRNKKDLNDVTATPFFVSFSQLPAAKKYTENRAAVMSLRSFLFREDFNSRMKKRVIVYYF